MKRVYGAAWVLLLASCSSATQQGQTSEIAVDSDRLMRVVSVLAHDSMAGRAVATEGSAKARRFLLAELQARGIAPLGPSYEHPFEFTRQDATTRGVNLLGVIRGTEQPERYIVVTAHYDHVGIQRGEIHNGADDNASGTAAALEIGSWFQRNRPRHSIIIALVDAEENGLRGARAFNEKPPVPAAALAFNVNMDMVGRNEKNELWAVGTRYRPALRPLVEQAAARSPLTIRFGHDGGTPGEQDWTGSSDHGPFHQKGIPFLYFGVEDHADYHKPTDDVERIMPAFHANAAKFVIDVIRVLDANLESVK